MQEIVFNLIYLLNTQHTIVNGSIFLNLFRAIQKHEESEFI